MSAGECHSDRLVRRQRQAAAGAVSDDAELIEQLVVQVVGLVHHLQRLTVVRTVDDGPFRLQRLAVVRKAQSVGTDRLTH